MTSTKQNYGYSMQAGLPLPAEEAVALFSYQGTVLIHCCSFRTTKLHSKSLEQQLITKDGGERGGETGKESSRNFPNLLDYNHIQYPTDKRQEKGFSFLPAFLRSGSFHMCQIVRS